MAFTLALNLSPEAREHIAELQGPLKNDFREVTWLTPQNFFVVVRFLGDLNSDQIKNAQTRARKIAQEIAPFDFLLAGADCFPPTNPPRSVWIGVNEQGDMLWRLLQAVEKRLTDSVVTRATIPHIVIGRVPGKSPAPNLRKLVQALPVKPVVNRVDEMLLISSKSTREGADYEIIDRFLFGATVHA